MAEFIILVLLTICIIINHCRLSRIERDIYDRLG